MARDTCTRCAEPAVTQVRVTFPTRRVVAELCQFHAALLEELVTPSILITLASTSPPE